MTEQKTKEAKQRAVGENLRKDVDSLKQQHARGAGHNQQVVH